MGSSAVVRAGNSLVVYAPGRHASVSVLAVVLSGIAAAGCGGGSSTEAVDTISDGVSAPQRVAIPSYYWFDDADWADVTPANSIGLAMINPESGKYWGWSAGEIAGFQSRFQALRALSPRPLVFGYVYTRYANEDPNNSDGGIHNRSVAEVQTNIDKYFQYFPELDGIFLDETTVTCDHRLDYYQDIYAWMQVQHPGRKIALNPGTSTAESECYLKGIPGDSRKAGDILVTFENTYAEYAKCRARPAWEMSYPAETFWHLVHETPASALGHALALSRARNAGWVYVTDLSTWNSIATNIVQEGADVAANGAAYSPVRHFSARRASNRYVFEATFDQSFAYHQAYIDSRSGGFDVSGIHADYLIENGIFRVYAGTGGNDWDWDPPAPPTPDSSNLTVSGNTYSWWVPLTSITVETSPVTVAFRGGNTPSVTTPSCVLP